MSKFPEVVGLGTLLRHLVDLMDGDIDRIYEEEGLACKSRFTPVIRHLNEHGPSTIKAIASSGGLTHSATSQTVLNMLKMGLVRSQAGNDGRERIISFTAKGKSLLPALDRLWAIIGEIEDELNSEAGVSLRKALQGTITALHRVSFKERVLSGLERSRA